jgi:hypothetical protein
MKRIRELNIENGFDGAHIGDELRHKHVRYSAAPPPPCPPLGKRDLRSMRSIVREIGRQANYKIHAEYNNLLDSSIKNYQTLIESTGGVSGLTTVQLLACVSVAAKRESNLAFDLESALRALGRRHCVAKAADHLLLVQAELTIALGRPPLPSASLRTIKDTEKYWNEYKN